MFLFYRCLLKNARKMVHPGGPLTNPRSLKFKERIIPLKAKFQGEFMDRQLADLPESHHDRPVKPKKKSQRSLAYQMLVGEKIAEGVRTMTDEEWEGVSYDDKRAFVRYIGRLIREFPTHVSEQQRRRYFETTIIDPKKIQPHKTVYDPYERIKLGLPVEITHPQQKMGVTQAIYESQDAALFDPNDSIQIENTMIHLKQLFSDFIHRKRSGEATEVERRRLANLTEKLNTNLQKYLARMFHHTDSKIQEIVKSERLRQLKQLETLRTAITENKRQIKGVPKRKERYISMLRQIFGLDTKVITRILRELSAQEKFLTFCDVLARLTIGHGFYHTSSDESLDEYTDYIRRLYSVDPVKLATIDAVQFYASQENMQPLDWAKRWYEKAILLPLQETDEYCALERLTGNSEGQIAVSDNSLTMTPSLSNSDNLSKIDNANNSSSLDAESDTTVETVNSDDNAISSTLYKKDFLVEDASYMKAKGFSSDAAHLGKEKVSNIVQHMFTSDMSQNNAKELHEKRLRYFAYKQMSRQIKKARETSKIFQGIEDLPEAERCRQLYQLLLARQKVLRSNNVVEDRIFHDPEVKNLFQEIQIIARDVMKTRQKETVNRKIPEIAHILRTLQGPSTKAILEIKRMHEEKKRSVMEKIVGVLETDVRDDVQWLEELQEADRPPLLPIPEPLSYYSAADIQSWKEIADESQRNSVNPFKKNNKFQPTLFGQSWKVPDKPLLFWGTGITALRQGLKYAAEDAERRRRKEEICPPYPCTENPWGWRLAKDILDD